MASSFREAGALMRAWSLAAALALAVQPALADPVIGSGHVLGNGTSASRTATDTPLIAVMNQPGSGLGAGVAAALGLPSLGTGAIITANGMSGNSGVVAQSNGTFTSGHCVAVDANQNLVDSGGACGGSGGTPGGASGQVQYNNGGLFGGISRTGNGNIASTTGATTTSDCAKWDASGNLIDSGAPCGAPPGGSGGQVQFNNGGTFGGLPTSGNGTTIASTSGALTSGDCVKIDASGNLVDAGGACGGSGSTPGGSTGQIQYNNGGVFGGRPTSGTGTTVATTSGTLTNGHCVSIGSAGDLVDAGGICTTGGGGGTVNAGTAGQIAYYQSSGSAVSGSTCTESATGVITCNGAVIGAGSLSSNALTDWRANSPNVAHFNASGVNNSYWRYMAQLTNNSGPQEQTFHACDVTATPSSLQEYDCAWFQAIATSAGSPTTGANAVGLRSEGLIPSTQSAGSAWGGIDYGIVQAGGNGEVIAREVDVINGGPNNSNPRNAATMKVGIAVANLGTNNATAAMMLTGVGFYNGYWAQTGNFTTSGQFIWLDNGSGGALFAVDKSGNVGTNGTVTAGGNISAAGYSASGSAGANCTGVPTSSFKVVNGIVTHC